jgi:FKBP-type peptidyl-prolyl cis-trans isomerase
MTAGTEKNSAKVISEGDKFLAENKTKPGVVTTSSGLQYLVLKGGAGPKPKRDAEVTVHYKGTLLNGKQFDSSYDRGEPLTFPLSNVIPGWVEGVQLMQEGSKYRFFIPWKLGYGSQGAGQDIPPYSVLIFEIELLKAGK